jgi:dolichol kinase
MMSAQPSLQHLKRRSMKNRTSTGKLFVSKNPDIHFVYLGLLMMTWKDCIAEVVGSNPTQSVFISLVKYGIKLSSFVVIVGQNL